MHAMFRMQCTCVFDSQYAINSCSELNIGLELDLVCRLELDPAVDSDLLVTGSWTKDDSPLSPDSSRLMISKPVKVQRSPQVFESIVSFRTLIAEDAGSYNCTLAIQAVKEMYIAGTTTTVNRKFAVKGRSFLTSGKLNMHSIVRSVSCDLQSSLFSQSSCQVRRQWMLETLSL